jgi:hypothetical protein
MNSSRYLAVVYFLALAVFAGGCGGHADITASVRAQQPALLGQWFRTTRQLDLLEDKPSGTLRLVDPGYPAYPRNRRVGVVDAGTALATDRAIRVTELAAFFVLLPVYYSWDCTLAKIDEGPFAGKEIAVGGESIELDVGTASVKPRFLLPTTVPSGK